MNSHFQIKYQFSTFTNFYIYKVFFPISQNSKMRKHAKRSQTQLKNERLYDHENLHRCYVYIGLHNHDAWYLVFYFQIWIMLQSCLIGRLLVAMATVLKFRLHGFVRNVLLHHLPKYVRHATFCFWVTFVAVFSQ